MSDKSFLYFMYFCFWCIAAVIAVQKVFPGASADLSDGYD